MVGNSGAEGTSASDSTQLVARDVLMGNRIAYGRVAGDSNIQGTSSATAEQG